MFNSLTKKKLTSSIQRKQVRLKNKNFRDTRAVSKFREQAIINYLKLLANETLISKTKIPLKKCFFFNFDGDKLDRSKVFHHIEGYGGAILNVVC